MPNDERRADRPDPGPDGSAEDEQRMRRALGLVPSRGGEARGRMAAKPAVVVHRNGRSGEPPVNRIAEAQTALAAERLAREQAEAGLRAAETSLKESETRRAHAELARDEALAALAEERGARQAAEERLRELVPPPASVVASDAPLPRRRGRPPKVARAVEPAESIDAPVEWWVPGWRDRMARNG